MSQSQLPAAEAPAAAASAIAPALEDFRAFVGGVFPLYHSGEEPLLLTLDSVTALSTATCVDERTPFSLLFRTPEPGTYPAQGTWEVGHPTLGNLFIFLVPLGPDERGMRIEAIFT